MSHKEEKCFSTPSDDPLLLLGVMNAADYYGLDELKKACAGFIQCCVNVDTVCALLATAERYIQYKCTKSLVQKVGLLSTLHSTPSFCEC